MADFMDSQKDKLPENYNQRDFTMGRQVKIPLDKSRNNEKVITKGNFDYLLVVNRPDLGANENIKLRFNKKKSQSFSLKDLRKFEIPFNKIFLEHPPINGDLILVLGGDLKAESYKETVDVENTTALKQSEFEDSLNLNSNDNLGTVLNEIAGVQLTADDWTKLFQNMLKTSDLNFTSGSLDVNSNINTVPYDFQEFFNGQTGTSLSGNPLYTEYFSGVSIMGNVQAGCILSIMVQPGGTTNYYQADTIDLSGGAQDFHYFLEGCFDKVDIKSDTDVAAEIYGQGSL